MSARLNGVLDLKKREVAEVQDTKQMLVREWPS